METLKNITEVEYMDHPLDDQVLFRAVCGCVDPYHDQELRLEYLDFGKDGNDMSAGMLELSIDHKMHYPDWNESNWFRKIWKRIKVASKLLFFGEVELDGGFMFSGEEAIRDYIKALQYGMKRLRQNKHNKDLAGDKNDR
jgi:hypothetical protein